MREIEVDRGGRALCVRDEGDPSGPVVMYFHGTPGSRLDLSFDEQVVTDSGARLVSFDRPGYGGSTPAPFGLASIAADAHAVADALGLARFATLGVSGGGPGALAAATVPGSRVSRVGVVSGAAPFQHVPGALDSLDDNDRAALPLLASDPAAAAAGFAAGFEPLAGLARDPDGPGVASALAGLLSPHDSELLADRHRAAAFEETMREALRQGTSGAGWDNVSWIGEWDIDPSAVRCPVLLWYGSDDRLAPPEFGRYLTQHLPQAQLAIRDGEGHMGLFEHLGEILGELTRPGSAPG